jgi:hypothetical protein
LVGKVQSAQKSLSSSVLDLRLSTRYSHLSYMPATQPHVDSGVLNPADAEPTIDRHAFRSARSHKTLDLNAMQRSPAPITPRSAFTMSLVLNQTRAWKSQESDSFKRDRDAKRVSSGYAVRSKSAPKSRNYFYALRASRSLSHRLAMAPLEAKAAPLL